jgi:4'-phosphopantetheinyl transferase
VRPQLKPGELHLFDLQLEPRSGDPLDESERKRAARFVLERDRVRFTSAHHQLRRCLAWLLDADPAALTFETGSHGKPFLVGRPLQFNLSHSHERALVGVMLDRELGVDIERARSGVEFHGIARRVFSAAERAAVSVDDPLEIFYRIWTQKEAFIKALGLGLACRLDSFDVSVGAEGGLEACRDHDASRWTMRTLPVEPGYAGAWCVEGAVERAWRWDGSAL